MTRAVAILVVTAFTCVACGDSTVPTIASPTPSASSAAAGPAAEGSKTFTITGTVMSMEKPVRSVADAKVEIVEGLDAARVTQSNGAGDFALANVNGGTLVLRASKAGYQTWTSSAIVLSADKKIGIELFLEPPRDANGVSATGRCNDGSWTWEQVTGLACTNNGGVAYGVCPGPICKLR
jgi:hypothetical protein